MAEKFTEAVKHPKGCWGRRSPFIGGAMPVALHQGIACTTGVGHCRSCMCYRNLVLQKPCILQESA